LSNEEATLREREQVLLQERAKMDADMPTPVLHQVATLRSDDVAIVRALNAVEQARARLCQSQKNTACYGYRWFTTFHLSYDRRGIFSCVKIKSHEQHQIIRYR
jgi:hypothetical protein